MTDNEIIKALECCKPKTNRNCGNCPAYDMGDFCAAELREKALYLINRQKAEIKRWQEHFRYLDFECERLEKEEENNRMEIEKLQEEIELLHTDYTYKFVKRKAKADAIREFAKRIKGYYLHDFEGETEQKKTCLWVKGVEPLKPTRKIPLPKEEITQGIFRSHFDGKIIGWNDPECARFRSRTPIGVGEAMAEQWG